MNIFPSPPKHRVLVAPLDWGLGHATRCIPVIHTLLKNGAEVWLAGDDKIAHLLQTEFPHLPLLSLPGYRIFYGKNGRRTFIALFRQLPKLTQAIKEEKKWLEEVVKTHGINAVVSDNRYGLHHPDIYSVFITHQLRVESPLPIADALLQKKLYGHINQFNTCWVPDVEEGENLSGDLAHPKKMPQIPVTYIGLLSRFTAPEPVLTHFVLIVLSGPEPQRTVLEKMLLQQAQLFQMPMLFVRGLPGEITLPKVPYHITIVNHLPTTVLQKAIESAQFVISRCGYSTVMDMMTLQKKCVFIPTPGQTEQEYLAKHLMEKNFALCLSQKKFQLKNALALAQTFPYQLPELKTTDGLQTAIVQLLQTIKSKQHIEPI